MRYFGGRRRRKGGEERPAKEEEEEHGREYKEALLIRIQPIVFILLPSLSYSPFSTDVLVHT